MRFLQRYESWFEVRLPNGRIGWVTGEFLNIAEGMIERLEKYTIGDDGGGGRITSAQQ